MKREGPKTRVIRQWNQEATETLRGCFEATDWDVFFENEHNLDTISDSITSYISFCEETFVPKKVVKIYPNTKPWISKEMSHILKEKKQTCKEGDVPRQKELEKQFRSRSIESK